MSQQTPPPGGAGGRGQPSEEEMQAALSQLRDAPLTDVMIDIIQGLLSAAQVKIGRRDGRLLLDLVSDVNERITGHVDKGLTDQVGNALTQLRMAQVEAEKEIAASGEEQPNDLAGPAAAAAATDRPQESSPTGQDSPTSRLWIPGQ